MTQVTNYNIPGSPLTMATLQTTLQNIFAAIGSENRGATAPSNPFEGMLWWDTAANPVETLKRYTVTFGWVSMLTVNITTGAYTVNGQSASETAVGLIELATQAEVTAGTDTTRAVTPATLSGHAITQGRHIIGMWQASAMKPTTTSGCAALASDESATNDVMTEFLAYDAAAVENAQFSFVAPASMAETTLTAVIEYKEASSATAHLVAWGVKMQAQGDGDTIDSAWGTQIQVNDTATSGTRRFTPETAAITPGGTWAAGDKIIVNIQRVATDATNDTLNVDAHFIAIWLFGTINAAVEP